MGAESLGRDDQAAKAERKKMHEDVYPHNEHTVIKQYTLIGKKNGKGEMRENRVEKGKREGTILAGV